MKSHHPNQKNHKIEPEQVVQKLELPKDLFLGMPLLALEGNRSLCIENHRGIVSYTSETIVIASRSYSIQIMGRNLMIPHFTRHIVEITGYMESISFLL